MPFKMVSTKNNPDEAKENAQPREAKAPVWRYGFRLTFDQEMLKELPGLKGGKTGDRIKISGEGRIVMVSKEDKIIDEKKQEDRRVEIQLEKVGVANQEDFDESFNEATEKEDEE